MSPADCEYDPRQWGQSITPRLLGLAWPIAVSTLSYSIMTLADTLVVSRLGVSELAGVGIGGIAIFTFGVFALGFLRSVKISVSQAVGAKREDRARGYLSTGLACALAMGALTLVIAKIAAAIAAARFAHRPDLIFASSYLDIRVWAAPAWFLCSAMRCALWAQGDSRRPMVATLLANFTNIGLDILLVVVLDFGVPGAAWASVIAQVIELAALAYFFPRLRQWLQIPDLGSFRKLAALGLPTGIQFTVEVGAFSLLTGIIASMGELELASHQLVLNLLHLSFLPAKAVGEAASVMTGQATGAKHNALISPVAFCALKLAGAYAILCSLLFAIAPETLLRMFTEDDLLVYRSAALLIFAAFFQCADAANIVVRSVLQGIGDVKVPALLTMSCSWLLGPPLAYWLGVRLELGAIGAWAGLCMEILVGALILWWRLSRRHRLFCFVEISEHAVC